MSSPLPLRDRIDVAETGPRWTVTVDGATVATFDGETLARDYAGWLIDRDDAQQERAVAA